MIVGECPSINDTRAGRITNERELDSVLADAGINRSEVWMTNVSKYFVPPNKKGKKIPFAIRAKLYGIDVEQQLKELQQEIKDIKPNAILGLSSTALWALTGKTDIKFFRGSILQGMGTKVVSTYAPSQLSFQAGAPEFKGYWNRQIMIVDAKRAYAQSQFSDFRLPQRTLEVCRNSAHLAEFYTRYKHLTEVSVDIESGGHCVPVCIGLAFNKQHGMCVPLWNADGISTIPDSDMIQIWLILAEILEKHDIIGQNFLGYDTDKLRMLGFRIKKLAHDVMMKAYAINPELPVGLAFNTSIFSEEPAYKDDGMYHGSYNDLFIGCARDSCVTFEINYTMDKDLDELGMRPFYSQFLMELPKLYYDIQKQGFKMDVIARDRLLRKYIEWDEKLRYELYALTGTDINVASPKQISILLFENLKLPLRDGTGEEELTSLLNLQSVTDPNKRRILELILEDRKVRKSISTYLMALPDYDGRMRTTYYLCLDTGRTSTGQQDPPIRPTVDVIDENGKKKHKVLGIAFQTMTKHGDIGSDIREMYIPDDEEEIFVQADSAQAEARVIFLLADDEQALKDIDEHDYHALTASWFFGGVEDDYSKRKLGYESPIRFVGKTLRHAGHLGAGKRRAAISVNTDARKYKIPITITEAIAEQALNIFHTKQPKIQKVFQAGIVNVLRKSRQLVAPVPFGLDISIGGKRTFFERWGEELNRAAFSYIPQRAVSDNTKMAGIRIKRRIPTIKIVMEAHDSLLFCIPIIKLQSWVPIIKEEMERPIDFSRCSLPRHELVIPCEIETGYNYRELKKFKDISITTKVVKEISTRPLTQTEKFSVVDLPEDSILTNVIYNNMEWKKRKFELD